MICGLGIAFVFLFRFFPVARWFLGFSLGMVFSLVELSSISSNRMRRDFLFAFIGDDDSNLLVISETIY